MRLLRDHEDQTDRKYLDLFDPATRLVRPPLLRDRLEVSLARALRSRRRVGLLFVDVHVPDDLPRTAGKTFDVLPLVAGRLRSVVRPDDTVGRVGEYEFVVICNDLTDEAELDALAERLRSVIGVRIFLDESRALLSATVETRLAHSQDHANDLLSR